MNEDEGIFTSTTIDPNKIKETSGSVIAFIIIVVIFQLAWCLYRPLMCIYPYLKSRKFKEKTRFPSKPKWLTDDLPGFQRIQKNHICVYTKSKHSCPIRKFCGFEQRGLNAVRHIVFFVQTDVYDTTIEDDTCIISIPKKNFKNGMNPGEFITRFKGESPHNFYEYQMVGNDNLQVTYYNVGGVSYVAGVCIYMENPYINEGYFNEEIIRKLLNGPDYWSMSNSEDVSIEVYHRIKNNEPLLITRNQYGIGNHWKFNGERRTFESITPIHSTGYLMNPDPDSPKTMKVKYCHSKNQFVMISKRNGRQAHSVWNKTTRRIQYLKCDTCNELEDARPPSYRSVMR